MASKKTKKTKEKKFPPLAGLGILIIGRVVQLAGVKRTGAAVSAGRTTCDGNVEPTKRPHVL